MMRISTCETSRVFLGRNVGQIVSILDTKLAVVNSYNALNISFIIVTSSLHGLYRAKNAECNKF